MARIKANEDVFKGQVIAWAKEQIEQGGLPFKRVTNDPSLYDLTKVTFPDVLLTLDFELREPFCGWELKTPTTNVRDSTLLRKAAKKAQTLDAKYFVTWNMQTAIIWHTPEKTRRIVDEKDKVREYGPDPRIQSVEDIKNREKSLLMEQLCAQLLRDLARLHKDENINLPLADTTVFVDLVGNVSEQMSGTLLKDINRAIANKKFNDKLNAWAKKQGVNKYDQDYRQTLAQQIAYKIIGKILFYMTMWRHKLGLLRMELPRENYKAAVRRMRELFQQALEVDYQAIFEKDITDEIELSADTAKLIIELTEKLMRWSFELMPLDVIGAVFEKLIPEDARHSLGQYFTPNNLVDLIVAFCVRNKGDLVMDPTCGTGTFLIRSYHKLRNMERKAHHELLKQIWGFDISGFPAELATINLYKQDFSDYQNYPRVLSQDFFEVSPGQSFEFPPPKKTAKTGERVREKIPKFDALMGNFPYIRQELIEKAEKGYKKKLEGVLVNGWGKKYPQLFKDGGEIRLSGQADIYAYLFFHTASHLKNCGRMGFVTSNSWLDVAYGYELQRFFLSKFKILAICESRCEPWFEQSAVNTVFTILERSDNQEARKNNLVHFVKVKKPLQELFPQDPLIDAQARWIRLEQFVDKIEGIAISGKMPNDSRYMKYQHICTDYIRQPEIISYEDEEVRIRMIRQEDLKEEVELAGQTVKWGQYLRGPEVYFKILQKCADKFIPLGKGDKRAADVRRGITTGINEFFYVTDDQIKFWGIEKEFLKPVVASTKEIPTIFVDEKKLKLKIFVCDKPKNDLRGTGALKYIRNGEKEATKDKTKWPDVPSVKGRKYWYTLPEQQVADFLILRFRDRRHYTPVNPNKLSVGDVVFVGEFKDKSQAEFGCAFLNSVLTALFAEIFGRINLGDGLLTTYGPELEILPMPLKDVNKLSRKSIKKALTIFRKLGKQKALSFEKEIKKRDRKEFEKAVFECLGLTQEDYKAVCKAVSELIEERHLLPKLRTSKKKKRFEHDLEKLAEEISNEILQNRVSKFPEGFINGWSRVKCEEISVPEGKLKLGESFFEKQEICDSDGKHVMEVSSEEKGKFIVYAKKGSELVIKVPVSKMTIKKAIQKYETYLKNLREELYTAFMEKCGDHSVSENLTRQVFEDFPDIR